ncbi:MAG: nuclear transport factor 2 family protein [Noviherbaspirillum sp.]
MDAAQTLERLAGYFESMSAASVAHIGNYYADDAVFKDPFNDVRGVPAIRRVFSHMFEQVDLPRFIVTARMAGAGADAMLVWEFHFRARLGLREQAHLIRGASHLQFDAAGKVSMHRDYWDAAEELYGKLPLLGGLMRGLARKLAA